MKTLEVSTLNAAADLANPTLIVDDINGDQIYSDFIDPRGLNQITIDSEYEHLILTLKFDDNTYTQEIEVVNNYACVMFYF